MAFRIHMFLIGRTGFHVIGSCQEAVSPPGGNPAVDFLQRLTGPDGLPVKLRILFRFPYILSEPDRCAEEDPFRRHQLFKLFQAFFHPAADLFRRGMESRLAVIGPEHQDHGIRAFSAGIPDNRVNSPASGPDRILKNGGAPAYAVLQDPDIPVFRFRPKSFCHGPDEDIP